MAPALDYDPIQLNRIIAWNLRLSMILSENRYPLFGIMLQGSRKAKMAAQMWRAMRRRSIQGSHRRAWREPPSEFITPAVAAASTARDGKIRLFPRHTSMTRRSRAPAA